MSITLLVMTDGRRDCIAQAIPAAEAQLHGPITRRVIHDDSADPNYRDWLVGLFGDTFEVFGGPVRQGFGGAIRSAWEFLLAGEDSHPERFVFHLEDDFVLLRPVDLEAMIDVLDSFPHLVQLALRRQPWNDEEQAAGGIVESHPDDYIDVVGRTNRAWAKWLEHRRFFTTNPSLYRTTLCRKGWPEGEHSEGIFTHRLLADPDVRFGFWGDRKSGEAVSHIGNKRVGVGY